MGHMCGKPLYSKLKQGHKNKLNMLLEEAVTQASIDYSNKEIQDIQTAIHTILKRVVTRLNDRGIFKVSRI